MSQASTGRYETLYILKPTLSESDAAVISQKVANIVSKFKGSVEDQDDWGVRDLSYQIKKFSTGRYHAVVYTGQGGVVEEIERHFKISSEVIRFLTVAVASDYDYKKVKSSLLKSDEDRKNRETRRGESRGGGRDYRRDYN